MPGAPVVLSDPAALSAILTDYPPSSPREAGPLLAAAQADMAGLLRDHVALGMDPATAIRLAAAILAVRAAFSSEACLWVTGQLAIALGLTTADRLPQLAPPGEGTAPAALAADSSPRKSPRYSAVSGPARVHPSRGTPRSRRRRGRGRRSSSQLGNGDCVEHDGPTTAHTINLMQRSGRSVSVSHVRQAAYVPSERDSASDTWTTAYTMRLTAVGVASDDQRKRHREHEHADR